MWSMLALTVLPFFGGSPMTDVQPSDFKPRLVHGFLYAHWEYPNFLPDDFPNQRALPFEFNEKKWRDVYSEPDEDARKYRPNETPCFKITGEGYVAPRKPDSMWPANEQFIFTKIKKLEKMKTEAECEKRLRRSDR
jgi:hypothetical protein